MNAVHPGIVNTELGRHMGMSDSIMASIFVKPLLSFFLKSSRQGSLTSLYVSLDPSLQTVSGKYFRFVLHYLFNNGIYTYIKLQQFLLTATAERKNLLKLQRMMLLPKSCGLLARNGLS